MWNKRYRESLRIAARTGENVPPMWDVPEASLRPAGDVLVEVDGASRPTPELDGGQPVGEGIEVVVRANTSSRGRPGAGEQRASPGLREVPGTDGMVFELE